MIRVDHFTGSILLSEEEADQVRVLLAKELAGKKRMTLGEATRLMQRQNDLVSQFTGNPVQ